MEMLPTSCSPAHLGIVDDQQPVNPFLSVNGSPGDAPTGFVSSVIMDSTNLPAVANFGRGFDWTISNTQTSGYASTITGAPLAILLHSTTSR